MFIYCAVVLALALLASVAMAVGPSPATQPSPSAPVPGRQVMQHDGGFDDWLYLPAGFDTEIAIAMTCATAIQGGALQQFPPHLTINETDGKTPLARFRWNPTWRSVDDGLGTFQCLTQ